MFGRIEGVIDVIVERMDMCLHKRGWGFNPTP